MMTNLELLRKIHEGANECFNPDDEVVCHIAILRSWIDRESPENLAYVFDPNDDRFYDRLYTIDRFLNECKRIIDDELEESYFSINSFWRKNKHTEDIRHLNAFALDFDFYKKKKYQNLSPVEMYETHIKPALPMKPTAVIDSGRGLYVIYAFHHCSIVRIKLYQAIYKQFLDRFINYGMDPKAINVTQVIRVPGSYNVKANKTVEIIDSYNTEYELTDFCQLLPFTYEQVQVHREEQKEKRRKKEEVKVSQEARKERRKKCKIFLADLRKLIAMRNHQGYYEGYRELVIYLALEKMLWAGYDKDLAIKEASKLNDEFHWPLKEYSVEKQCMPAQVHYCTHSVKTVITKLEISEEEQKKLHVLVSREHKDLHRKHLKNKHPLLNRSKKEVEQLMRRTEVIKLKKEGKRNTDIANALEVDKSTITLDLKYINAHKHEFRKVLGDSIEALESALNDENLVRKTIYDELKRLRRWAEMSAYVLADP